MLKRAESACIHEERDVLGLDDRRWSQTVTTPSKMRTSIFIYHSHVASPFKKKKLSQLFIMFFYRIPEVRQQKAKLLRQVRDKEEE